MSDIEGGCACGAVRFKIAGPMMGAGTCHCVDCQKASGGGPAYVALAPKLTPGVSLSTTTQEIPPGPSAPVRAMTT